MKFIHAADIHLDSPLVRLEAYEGAPVGEIRGASRRAFENLIGLALAEAVDFVLIAGDLFDGEWRDYNTGLFFVNQVRRLDAAGIAVFVVAGNHDAAGQVTGALPYPGNVVLFGHQAAETRVLEGLRVAVHGRSFGRPAETENLAAGYPEPVPGFFNVGLLHTSVTGREGHAPYAPCAVGDLTAKGYDYWALGHVHQFEQVAVDPPVVFAGCIQGRHIREAGVKGCVLVRVDDADGAVALDFRPLDVVRWVPLTVDVAGCGSREDCLDRLQAALPGVLAAHAPLTVVVRVIFVGACDAHGGLAADPEAWAQAVRAAALAVGGERVWVEKVRVATRPGGVGSAVMDGGGPMGELVAYLEALRSDEAALGALGERLADVWRKLPPEVRRGGDVPRPDDAAGVRELLDQAEALLLQRLQEERL